MIDRTQLNRRYARYHRQTPSRKSGKGMGDPRRVALTLSTGNTRRAGPENGNTRTGASSPHLLGGHKPECDPVHAVTFAGGRRAVVKDMTQMRIAPSAQYFRPHHTVAIVGLFHHVQR